MTPDDMMRQAAMTAELYAREGSKVFMDIFGVHPGEEPKVAVDFLKAFMRTAAHDFEIAMREYNK